MYMENAPAEILTKDVHDLGISLSLAHLFEINQLSCLKDLLDCPMEEWFGFTGFNQHRLNELLNYLDHNRLIALVRE